MTTRRTLLALPVVALAGVVALGSLATAAPSRALEARIGEARSVVTELVHQGAAELAERTDRRPQAAPPAAPRLTEGPRDGVRTGPAPRIRPPDSRLPTRALDGRDVPDFVALQDDAHEGRAHSGRRPPG